MLEKVKIALRISHSVLDEDILATIQTAKDEIVRAGVDPVKANDDSDNLITQAIKTYCLAIYSPNDKVREGYFASFQYQLDNIRKSNQYAK